MTYTFPDRREGLFKLGDRVHWTTHGKRKRGVIVEVVKWGMYPLRETPVRCYGYYREMWSYVVRCDNGKHYWPRVGNLRGDKR